MKQFNILLNKQSYLALLKFSLISNNKEFGARVSENLIQQLPLFNNDRMVLHNSLLNYYCKAGELESARKVFNTMKTKDVFTWTTMISGLNQHGKLNEAIQLFREMKNLNIIPNERTYSAVLSVCAKLKDKKLFQEIEKEIKSNSFADHNILEYSLLTYYCKVGEFKAAWELFDKINIKDGSAWTNMISGLSKGGYFNEVLHLFQKMKQVNVPPNEIIYSCVLSACAELEAKEFFKEIENNLDKEELIDNVILATNLIKYYCKVGELESAWEIFENMKTKNIISWTVMISGLIQHGKSNEAIQLFREIHNSDRIPKVTIYRSIISACSDLKDKAKQFFKEIEKDLDKEEFAIHLSLQNNLLNCYWEIGEVESARSMFNNMQTKDSITWTIMISALIRNNYSNEAIQLFQEMKKSTIMPDEILYSSLLSSCFSSMDKVFFKEIENEILKQPFSHNLVLYNNLLNYYCKVGEFESAGKVFNNLQTKDETSWTIMIQILVQERKLNEAIQLFREMKKSNVIPNEKTYSFILNACADSQNKQLFKELEEGIKKFKFTNDLGFQNSLINYYCRIGELGNAKQYFDKIKLNDVSHWTTMILGLVECKKSNEAIQLFQEMKNTKLVPDLRTYTTVLSACADLKNKTLFKEIEKDIKKEEYANDLILQTNLINYYCKVGEVKAAREVFNRMKTKNEITWRVMILGLSENGHSEEALQLLQEMKNLNVFSDEIIFPISQLIKL